MPFAPKIRPYRVVTYSWIVPPIDHPMGLDAHGLANTFRIMEGPLDVGVRLNDVSEGLLEFVVGVDGVVISEIYITSAQLADTVKIYVGWEVQWE